MNNINFKKRIYFEIETKKRELLSRCYFALLAANKGYSVIIGKKNKLYQNLKNLQNGYFIFKSAGRSVKKLAPKLRELNYLPFSIDEEGGVIISPHDTTRRVDKDSLDKIEKYLSWGNDEKNAILSSKINYKDKIINVGNPRIDLLKFKNRKIYDRKVNELIKKFGKFNLYATSFHKFNSVGNSKNPNWIEEDVKNNLILKEHKEHITIINETQKKNLEGTLSFFKLYEKTIGLPKLIVRPHPAEDNNTYLNVLKNFKNIKLIDDEESIVPWILASVHFISCNCTAQIESYLLGKKSINLEFVQDKKLQFDVINLVTNRINNNIDIIDTLKNNLLKDDDIEKKREIINELRKKIFNVDDSICSVESICSVLNKKLIKSYKIDKEITKIYFFYLKLKSFLLNKYFFIRTFFNQEKKIQYEISKKKTSGIELNEVKEILNNINNIYNFKNIGVREILPGVFQIEKK